MGFAKNLQALRKSANLSQENLADQLHISRQAVSKWEQGQSTPDLETCIKLCEILNVTPNQLLLGSDSASKPSPSAQNTQFSVFFIVSSIFMMLVCACGTFLMIFNLNNGDCFEPQIHTQALWMIRGSMIAFAAALLFCLWQKFIAHKRNNIFLQTLKHYFSHRKEK